MKIQENISSYAKWPNEKLVALSKTNDNFKNILSDVDAYRRSTSKEIKKSFNTVDDAINYVKSYDRSAGEIRVRLERQWIYSINIDEEDYHSLLTIQPKEKHVDLKVEREDALANLEYRKEEGKKYIDPRKHKIWVEKVEDLTDFKHGKFHNQELDKTIEILRVLQDDREYTINKSLNLLLQTYAITDESTFVCVALVTQFSAYGPLFAQEYINELKSKNVIKAIPKGINELIKQTNEINRLIEIGAEPELVFEKHYELFYMPIIYEEGVHDIYLLKKEEGIYEGTLDGNLVTVLEDKDFLDVRIIMKRRMYTFNVPKGNKPIRVDEYREGTPTGKQAIIYFTQIYNYNLAIRQAVLNQEVENKTKLNLLAKSYRLKK